MMILVGPLFGPRRLGKREKAKQENLTAFSPLPNVQKNEESVTKLSMKSASSSKSSMKLNLNKKFNNTKSDNCAPKEFVIKTRDGVKEENNDELLSALFIFWFWNFFIIFHNFNIKHIRRKQWCNHLASIIIINWWFFYTNCLQEMFSQIETTGVYHLHIMCREFNQENKAKNSKIWFHHDTIIAIHGRCLDGANFLTTTQAIH